LEESVHSLRIETDSSILHGQSDPISFVYFGSDQHPPRTIVNAAHRVGCVPEQVQDDLLKLHAIACDNWEVVGKFQ
jgi:hypothetical protein